MEFDLKDLIKAKKTNDFSDIDADKLTLWRVSIPDHNQASAITIDAVVGKKELKYPRTRLSKEFSEASMTIHTSSSSDPHQ
ncbi:hypothetical protein BGZ82_001722, partial [Podila clonocystis]